MHSIQICRRAFDRYMYHALPSGLRRCGLNQNVSFFHQITGHVRFETLVESPIHILLPSLNHIHLFVASISSIGCLLLDLGRLIPSERPIYHILPHSPFDSMLNDAYSVHRLRLEYEHFFWTESHPYGIETTRREAARNSSIFTQISIRGGGSSS